MNSEDQTLPNDVKALTELVLQLQSKLSHQSDYIKQLIEAIQLAKHQHFGTRSEQFNGEQLSLFNEAEVLADQQGESHNHAEETTTVGPYQRPVRSK